MHDVKLNSSPGGFAVVRSAYHALTGEKVAVKILDKQKLGVSGLEVDISIRMILVGWGLLIILI